MLKFKRAYFVLWCSYLMKLKLSTILYWIRIIFPLHRSKSFTIPSSNTVNAAFYVAYHFLHMIWRYIFDLSEKLLNYIRLWGFERASVIRKEVPLSVVQNAQHFSEQRICSWFDTSFCLDWLATTIYGPIHFRYILFSLLVSRLLLLIEGQYYQHAFPVQVKV